MFLITPAIFFVTKIIDYVQLLQVMILQKARRFTLLFTHYCLQRALAVVFMLQLSLMVLGIASAAQ
jgi:hypothetical protein